MTDYRIQSTEKMVGAGHSTLSDTLNRLSMVEHNNDGTHNKLTKVTDPYIDVRAYGAVGDGVTDDTAAIQAAIDACYTAGGGTVFFPSKTFAITSITRKNHVMLKGAGAKKTKLLALTSTSTGLILTDIGPVTYAHIEDMAIWGGNGTPVNAGQWAIYSVAVAQAASPYDGGEWFSNHKNIDIRYFDNGIWYKGGYSGFLLPVQFITHENISLTRASDTGNSLKMTGQVGQFLDLNGRYDGTTKGLGTNILVSKDGGSNHTYTLNFIGTTSQKALHAYDIEYGYMINIMGNNIEETNQAVLVRVSSRCVNIQNNKLANAGSSDGGGTGYILYVSTSDVSFEDNLITGTYDKVVTGASSLGIKSSGNTFTTDDLPYAMTSGITIQKNVVAGPPVSLNLDQHRDILVNTSASVITQINSLLMPGEHIYLRAWTGPITLGTGGNIYLGGVSSMIVPNGVTVTFRRTDIASTAWLYQGLSSIPNSVSEDTDNSSITATVRSTPSTIRFNSPITTNRSVVIPTANAANGDKFRVVRESGATGAFDINIKMLDSLSVPLSAGYSTLKSLTNSPSAGQWSDIEFDGTDWRLTAYGTL